MRFFLSITTSLVFITNVLAAFTVINYCIIPVHYFADLPSQPPDVSGTIAPNGGTYQENYKGDGRAFKIWTDAAGQGALLVVGYSFEQGDPFVWASLNEVNGAPFEGELIYMSCTNPNPGPVFWANGVPGSTGTISCSPPGPGVTDLYLALCAENVGHENST